MSHIVIGSGPSGVSVATALLARGIKVVMLDAGKTLEPHLADRRSAMAQFTPGDWPQDQVSAFQEPQFVTPAGQARRFGSDFAMEPADATLADPANAFGLRASRAAGGLSNYWGSAVLPYRQGDIDTWPISIDDLKPHYRAVSEFMPISARKDDLNLVFPGFPIENGTSLKPGVQATEILARLDRAKPRNETIAFGMARNAVSQGCNGCGMCLHGCPWGHIYSAQTTLEQMKTNPDFTYKNGAAVAFEENSTGVNVHLEDGQNLAGERVFLATGVLETARILLNSTPYKGNTLTLLDSQQVLVPLLHRWRTSTRPDTPPLNTLPQVFMEMDDPAVSPHLVHSQIYTWNEHFGRDLIDNYGFGLGFTSPILRAMARRLIVAQMFLHSDHSARVDLSLAANGKLSPVLRENPETAAILKTAQKKLGARNVRRRHVDAGFRQPCRANRVKFPFRRHGANGSKSGCRPIGRTGATAWIGAGASGG